MRQINCAPCAAHRERQSPQFIERLPHRQIDGAFMRLSQTVVARVFDYAGDLINHWRSFRVAVVAEMRVNGIAVAEIKARRSLVEQRDFGRSLVVALIEDAALQQSDAERWEKARRNLIESNLLILFRRWREAV